MIAFGPVPSRRLGRSLGVNNIPAKHCSYSCVYCQIGPTSSSQVTRREFFPPDEVVDAVRRKVAECQAAGHDIDFVTFVPDGEPTLDCHLGAEIRTLKDLRIPIAVITNGSLLWRSEVRADLADADAVSVKIDTARSETWRRLNRPNDRLNLESILDGVAVFAAEYRGELLTETMLVSGVNDDADSVESVAVFLESLAAERSYLAVPIRPPTERTVGAPSEASVLRAYEIMRRRLASVELLVSGEEGEFRRTGDPLDDLCAILAVHPMKESAVSRYLAEVGLGDDGLETLVHSRVRRLEYRGEVFFVRRFGDA